MAPGELVGLLGPNGAGKSTLVRLLSGVVGPYRGSIRLLGDELAALGRREIARRAAVVPQEPRLELPFSALEVVLLGRHLSGLAFESDADPFLTNANHQDEIFVGQVVQWFHAEPSHRYTNHLYQETTAMLPVSRERITESEPEEVAKQGEPSFSAHMRMKRRPIGNSSRIRGQSVSIGSMMSGAS